MSKKELLQIEEIIDKEGEVPLQSRLGEYKSQNEADNTKKQCIAYYTGWQLLPV